MIYLISPDWQQYKANLHCHSVLSDGKKTPEQLKKDYRAKGYSILAITDHERPFCHKDLSEEGFLMLTGYECHIRPDPLGRSNRYTPEIHMNLFAKEEDNVKMINFNEPYCHFVLRDGALDTLERVGSERAREFTREYVNEYIETARANGYLVAYNHPHWSMEDEGDILALDGLFSLEVFNYGSHLISFLENGTPLYDKMLSRGRRILCHAGDDNHNFSPDGDALSDSYGAFTMIMPSELSYSGVIDAMEKGNMYASMGPLIHEVSLDGDLLHVKCSACAHVIAYVGSKMPSAAHAEKGKTITEATLKIPQNARFIRVAVLDDHGRFATTRGFLPDEYKAN